MESLNTNRNGTTFESQVKESVNNHGNCKDDVCTVTWSPDKEQNTNAQQVPESQNN